MKTVLNDTELFGQFRAGVRDSVAVTKYLYYIKREAAVQGLNEMEVTEKLHDLRALSDAFIIESFPTISAYGANAATVSYTHLDVYKRQGEECLPETRDDCSAIKKRMFFS